MYRLIAYRGFESLPLRHIINELEFAEGPLSDAVGRPSSTPLRINQASAFTASFEAPGCAWGRQTSAPFVPSPGQSTSWPPGPLHSGPACQLAAQAVPGGPTYPRARAKRDRTSPSRRGPALGGLIRYRQADRSFAARTFPDCTGFQAVGVVSLPVMSPVRSGPVKPVMTRIRDFSLRQSY